MKPFSISALLLLPLFFGMLVTNPKVDFTVNPKSVNAKRVLSKESSKLVKSKKVFTNLSGTYHGNGFYTYVNTLSINYSASCTWFVADVPNQITIKDPSGNVVFTKGWAGDANYYGPWGASIHTDASHPNTYYFGLAPGTYTVYVDTCTNVNNGGSDDAWYIYY